MDTARVPQLRTFRGRLAAAPLKANLWKDFTRLTTNFPRPFGRGPIEGDTQHGAPPAAALSAAVWPRPH